MRTAKQWTACSQRPAIVCLCGSTRFKEEFIKANEDETMKGKIVLTVGSFSRETVQAPRITKQEKIDLDILHLRKIDLSDEILVLDVDGYIGESTAQEIAYAESLGKNIRYSSNERNKEEAVDAPEE